MSRKFISTPDVVFLTLVAIPVMTLWYMSEKTSEKDAIQIEHIRNAITAQNAQEVAQVALDYVAADRKNDKKARKVAFEKLGLYVVDHHHSSTNHLNRTLAPVKTR